MKKKLEPDKKLISLFARDKNIVRMSDSVLVGMMLALAGGFMDAYSYIYRGGVFSNAQVGNFLKIGMSIANNNWSVVFRYFYPVMAFTIGIIIADSAQYYLYHRRGSDFRWFHWRQSVLAFELLTLVFVCFLPKSMNNFANALISFACGMQIAAFKNIHNHPISATMCVGNLRTGTELLCRFVRKPESETFSDVLLYYGALFFFICGAIMGTALIRHLGQFSLLVCAYLILLTIIFMFKEDTGPIVFMTRKKDR